MTSYLVKSINNKLADETGNISSAKSIYRLIDDPQYSLNLNLTTPIFGSLSDLYVILYNPLLVTATVQWSIVPPTNVSVSFESVEGAVTPTFTIGASELFFVMYNEETGNLVYRNLSASGGSNPITASNGLTNYADDAAAATGGIPINGLYRTGSAVKIRVS